VVLPEPETVELLVDKARFYSFAQQEGLPISPTFFLRSRADAIQVAKHLPYPSILKPSTRSVEWVQHTKLKAFNVANAEHLLALYDHYHAWADVLIAQEWIEGSEASHYTCNVYFDSNSEPLVTFVSRKLRQWPPGTGYGSLAEECRNDIVLNETVRLFRRVNYTGLGYLEMKRDERSGRYFIIEPNIGRPTGRSALAEASGVELLYTMYCDAVGLPLPSNRTQRYQGMKWIHLRRDIQSALYYWRRGDLTLREWWLSWRGPKTEALFSWSDPAPFLADLFGAARVYLSPAERNKRNYRRPAA
jgi:predicted ATP-grasp superfamily ATP-dependent carboligase